MQGRLAQWGLCGCRGVAEGSGKRQVHLGRSRLCGVSGATETSQWNLALILSEMGARDGLKQRTRMI